MIKIRSISAILAIPLCSIALAGPANPDAYITLPIVDILSRAPSAHIRTHICVTGTVAAIHKEKDGDIHIKLCGDSTHCLLLESIPEISIPKPRNRSIITACGIIRYDGWHKYWEIHPLITWRPQ